MSKYILKQNECQRRVIVATGADPEHFIGLAQTWWRNPLNPDSLRLTQAGFKWFTKVAELTAHEITIPKDQPIVGRHMLQLENLFEEPYFIRGANTIFVFGERDAVMLQLHAGNLTAYLDSLQNQ